MARIPPIQADQLSPAVKVAVERHLSEYGGGITNTKATLGYSLAAFEAYMQWYPLYERLEELMGKRLALFYAYTVSVASDCVLCTAFFRKRIMDAGEIPEEAILTATEKDILSFGTGIARHKGNIADHLYKAVASRYTYAEIVLLAAFTGQLIAVNVFNNMLETDTDDYLKGYEVSFYQ